MSATRPQRVASARPKPIDPAEDQLTTTEQIAVSIRRRRAVKPYTIVQLARGLKSMLGAGVSLHVGVRSLASQFRVESPRLSHILDRVADHLLAGGTLAEGFLPYEQELGSSFVELIGIGERGGVLESKALPRIIELYRRKARFHAGAITALIYPAIVLLGSIIVTWIALVYLVPAMETAYASIGDPASLPLLTRAISFASKTFISMISSVFFWLALLGVGIGALVLLRSEAVRERIDQWLLRIPLVSKLIRLSDMSRAFATLGVLLDAGMAMHEAVALSSRTAANRTIRRSLDSCTRVLAAGGTLTEGLRAHKRLFGQSTLLVVETGESSGTLPRQLDELASYYHEEATDLGQRLQLIGENLTTVILAVYVGVIALAVYSPIFTLYEKMAKSR